MKKVFNRIYLIILVTVNFSCVEKKASETEFNAESEMLLTSDTLNFTSGIGVVFQDSKGQYWLGSNEEGVSWFDGKSFRCLSIADGLPDNQVRSIQEDEIGMIWIGTANGVCSYDGKTIINHTKSKKEDALVQWSKTDNDLWFSAGNKAGVYRYDGHTLTYLAFPSPKVINPNNTYHITDMAKGKNDMLWIATYAGVFGYNGKEFTIINDETLGFNPAINRLHIRSILEDSKGRLWIGNNGIGVLLRQGDSTFNFSEKMNLMHPTSSRRGDKSFPGTLEHVFAIQEDSVGNIWFGDRDTGPWKYDGETITNYTIDKNLDSQMAWTIYEDQNKKLLFGMEAGGVYQFNGKSFDRMF